MNWIVVEKMGLEPTTSCMPCKRSSQLSYIPIIYGFLFLAVQRNKSYWLKERLHIFYVFIYRPPIAFLQRTQIKKRLWPRYTLPVYSIDNEIEILFFQIGKNIRTLKTNT